MWLSFLSVGIPSYLHVSDNESEKILLHSCLIICSWSLSLSFEHIIVVVSVCISGICLLKLHPTTFRAWKYFDPV